MLIRSSLKKCKCGNLFMADFNQVRCPDCKEKRRESWQRSGGETGDNLVTRFNRPLHERLCMLAKDSD